MSRERAIPCRGATLQESIRGTHKTWADDGYCDRCRVLAAQSIAMVRANHPTISRRPGSGLSSAPSFPVAAVSARVGVPRTSADAGTFDGFLSGPSDQQVHSSEGCPPALEPVPAGPAGRLRGQQSVNPSHGSVAHLRT